MSNYAQFRNIFIAQTVNSIWGLFCQRQFRVNSHRKCLWRTWTCCFTLSEGRNNRKFSCLYTGSSIHQCSSIDIAITWSGQTSHIIIVITCPCITHLGVFHKSGREYHFLHLVLVTNGLICYRIHHHLWHHLDGKVHRFSCAWFFISSVCRSNAHVSGQNSRTRIDSRKRHTACSSSAGIQTYCSIIACPAVTHYAFFQSCGKVHRLFRIVTHYHIWRSVHHHLWINGHGEFNSFTSTADTVIGIGWSNRELGYLWLFAFITQHCSKDVARIGLIHTCHHSSIVAGPAVGHLAVANGSAKVHRLTLLAMTKHLVCRRIHHHLRVHGNCEVNRVAFASHTICIGRCNRKVCYYCWLRSISHCKGINLCITRCVETYRSFIVCPSIAHTAISNGSSECHFLKLCSMTKYSAFRSIHHHGRIHRYRNRKGSTHTNSTSSRCDCINSILYSITRIG